MSEEEKYEQLRQVCLSYRNEVADLEAKLAESEEKKESYRLQNDEHHLQLLQFYSRLGVEAFGADIHEKALEALMIMKEELEEKNGVRRALSACNRQNDEFADMIKKLVSEKEELKQQLADKEKEKEKEIESLKIDLEAKDFNINTLMAQRKRKQKFYKQDKISFAVEQIKNLKLLILSNWRENDCNLFLGDIDNIFDNQIKQLKERQ